MNKSIRIAAVVLMASLVSIAAASAQSTPEQFTARIIDAGGAIPGANSAFVTIRVDEYSTDEEVAVLANLLARQGQDAVEDALRDIEKGWIRIGPSLGYPLSIARSFTVDGGRIIRVVTDRPIMMFESRRGLRSKDYPFGIVELRLDAEGKGSGRLLAAAQAEITPEGKLDIESYGLEPFRLVQAKIDQPKKKKPKKEKAKKKSKKK